ncbi:MAG: VOC family protein [Hyphomicrobiales bacterium]|nr:VOC family protein [Hyphomicrobiales bacterium]
MSNPQGRGETAVNTPKARGVDMKLEIVVIPVSDVDRAKRFYAGLGWRLDADVSKGNDFRVLQFTPPGSACSIIFGAGVTEAAPGSVNGLHLIVSNIEAARSEVVAHGVDVTDVFHDSGGVFHHAGRKERLSGPDTARRSYASFASFTDPDGNGWTFQEVTRRLPGRIDGGLASFTSSSELAAALRRAAAAHGEHEKRSGQPDANWPDWYAEYMVREQAGTELPS